MTMKTTRYPILMTILLLLSVWSIHACRTEPTAAYPADAAYFPLETGRVADYLVTEERYSLSQPPQITSYQLRERTGQAYLNATGEVAYRLHRYRRTGEADAWQPDSLWSAYRTNVKAYRIERNVTRCVLAFPIFEGQRWQTDFAYPQRNAAFLRNIHESFNVLGKTYRQTITVVETDDSTLVGQHRQLAVYAPAIGLIYRQNIHLSFCTDTPDCIGRHQIDYGIRQTFQLINYGKE